jgi:hypothetical protein
MVIGATLSNFGTPMKLDGRDARQFISVDPTKTGSNNQIPAEIEMDSWDLPLLFQLGVSTNVMKNDAYRWTIAADAIHPSDNYESLNLGTEFAYHDNIFLRTGYQSLFLDESEGGFSAGVGLSSARFIEGGISATFDYAYRDMGRLESVHTFSVTVRF